MLANYSVRSRVRKPLRLGPTFCSSFPTIMAGVTCRPIGTRPKCDFRTLEALAAKGVRFPNYHTVPLCGPSRACMFTGQYSTENGMWRGPGQQPLGSPGYRGIKRDVKILSERLSEAGYKTGAFGKWHLGSLNGEVPNDRGFDEFRGFLGGAHPYWIKEGRSKLMHNRQPDRTSQGHTTELFTEWADKFIRDNAGRGCSFLLLPRLQRGSRSASRR